MAGKYIVPEEAWRTLKLSEEQAEKNKSWFQENVPKANLQSENDTFDLFDSFPTVATDDDFVTLQNLAIAWLKYQWAIKESDEKSEESHKEEYQLILAGIKNKKKFEPSERQDLVVIESDYKSEPLNIRSRLFD